MRHIVIFLVSFLFISTAQAADSYSVGAGASVTITEHSVCHVVTNGLSQALFVPTKSAAEWTSFRANTPPGVTSVACDTTPNAFSFTDQTGQQLNTLRTSNTVTIGGINTATTVSVSGAGSPKISINGGAWVTSGTIQNGQTLRVQLTSANAFSTARSATVNVGGVTDGWSVTTRAAANCSNTTMRWTNASSGPCQAASGSMTHGQSKNVTNTASGYTGTRNLSCSDGTISQSGGSCEAGSSCGGGGYSFDEYCYYYGAKGQTCDTVCSSRGGCDLTGTRYIGSAGTNARCIAVADALAVPYTTTALLGLGGSNTGGCTFVEVSHLVRYTKTTTCGWSLSTAWRLCACNN